MDATGDGDDQIAGGSLKIIADTADRDRSVGLNNPGQFGGVRCPRYRDLCPLWACGLYFPIYFSPARVAAATERTLLPGPAAR